MLLYLDASAVVKLYVDEAGSDDVAQWIDRAQQVGTSLISRTEVVAALAKAVRVGALDEADALTSVKQFREAWPSLIRVQIGEAVVQRADELAWMYGLRGYNAVHLASASTWQAALENAVTFVTYDRQLWHAANGTGLSTLPDAVV